MGDLYDAIWLAIVKAYVMCGTGEAGYDAFGIAFESSERTEEEAVSDERKHQRMVLEVQYIKDYEEYRFFTRARLPIPQF